MALSNGTIILIVMVCCGAFVCCLGAVGWIFLRPDYARRGIDYGWRPTNIQDDYMRKVRHKNHEDMFHTVRYYERTPRSQTSGSNLTSDVTSLN
jgi:hypothetical protein